MTNTRPILLRFAVASAALILAVIGAAGLRSGAAWQAAAGLTILGARVSLPDRLPKIAAQEDKMRQVVRNLLDNALKFTQENGRIDISASTANGRLVEVRVSDNGIGIPPESIPHIFERFYKVERSRRNAGSGLGLAIVKNIVQAFGGQVHVESKEGEGSTLSHHTHRGGRRRFRGRGTNTMTRGSAIVQLTANQRVTSYCRICQPGLLVSR